MFEAIAITTVAVAAGLAVGRYSLATGGRLLRIAEPGRLEYRVSHLPHCKALVLGWLLLSAATALPAALPEPEPGLGFAFAWLTLWILFLRGFTVIDRAGGVVRMGFEMPPIRHALTLDLPRSGWVGVERARQPWFFGLDGWQVLLGRGDRTLPLLLRFDESDALASAEEIAEFLGWPLRLPSRDG